MKTKRLKQVFVILSVLAIVFLIACTREFIEPPMTSSLTVAQAKSWFLTREITPVMMLKSSTAGKKADCTPDWEHAFTSSNDDYEVVEIPITSQTQFSFSTEESMDLSKKNNESGYRNSNSRFIIQRNKRTRLQEGYIMTIIGDADYLKANNFQVSNNSYLRKDKDFSGYVLFHDIDGNFVNGWQYRKGKVSRSMTLVSPNQSSFKLKTAPVLEMCQIITIYDYYIDDPSNITIIDQYISCSTSGGGGYAGSGNSGGSGGGSEGSTGAYMAAFLAGFNPDLFLNNVKPILEEKDKCTGVQAMWNQYPNNEVQGFLTQDNQIILVGIGDLTSTESVRPYLFEGTYYYNYPTSLGAPENIYQGMKIGAGRYFIPIKASIHTHAESRYDGTDGLTGFNLSEGDSHFVNLSPGLTNWVIGNGAVGQFDTRGYFNIHTGSLSSNCSLIDGSIN